MNTRTEMKPKMITFVDNKGHRRQLRASLTIEDLVKMGMKNIRIEKPDAPLPDGWIRSVR